MLEKKIYNFDFGSKNRKIISYVESFFMYLSLLFLINFGGIFYVYFKIIDLIDNAIVSTALFRIILICIISFELYGLVIQFLPKQIVLTDSEIKIKRNNISRLTLRLFNDRIKYKNIKSCEMNDPQFKARRVMQLPFIIFNWNSVVKIQEGFRTFYIPVENAEEFVEEVNKRLKIAENTENGENAGDDFFC